MTLDIGIPTALKKLNRLYERLESIRIDLSKFVSYTDEGLEWKEQESLLGTMNLTIDQLGETVDSIRNKVDTLLEDEPQ